MKAEHVTYAGSMLQTVCQDIALKCVGAVMYVVYSFSFDTAQEKGHIALFLLIIIDFVTGIAAAKKNNEEIKSAKVSRTVIKMLTYFLFLAAARYVELAVPIGTSFIDETILAFLAITELISIIENVGKMGYAIPQKLLNKLEKLRDSK